MAAPRLRPSSRGSSASPPPRGMAHASATPSPRPSPPRSARGSPATSGTPTGWHSCSEGSEAPPVPPVGVVKVTKVILL